MNPIERAKGYGRGFLVTNWTSEIEYVHGRERESRQSHSNWIRDPITTRLKSTNLDLIFLPILRLPAST
jgi:hypothetical protein